MTQKKATFEHSVDVLVKAYFDGTLVHGDFCACAVGNLIASAHGASVIPQRETIFKWSNGYPKWHLVFYSGLTEQKFNKHNYHGEIRDEIEATGYTLRNLMRIEAAFESTKTYPVPKCEVFNGLMAVVDVLADIHGVDLSVKQNAVTRFEEIHATK